MTPKRIIVCNNCEEHIELTKEIGDKCPYCFERYEDMNGKVFILEIGRVQNENR